ncbi:MAG: FlgD immunoglobulin-like domain containing protein, partial [Candidatus Eisenbacteria bacterium]
ADAPASAPREAEVSLRLASALPSSATAALEWELPRAMSAHLALYAVDGSLVRTLARGQAAAGTRRFEWDGRDESGQRVGAGLYFARLDTPAGVSTRRVLLAR